MPASFARNAIALGILAAVGPFAIDMYLPALPAIGADLGASTTAVQLSLVVFFASVALFQVVYGPLSDRFGRRPMLLTGLGLFLLGGIGCAFAPTIGFLIAFRILQGIGACAAMTLPQAIVRDLHTGPEAARLMAFVILVLSVSPILAPLAGSFLVEVGTWRAIFGVIIAGGLIAASVVLFVLPETLPAQRRRPLSPQAIAGNYRTLFRDPRYIGVVMIGGFGISSFFAFIGGSSFIYIDHFGVSPTVYSLLFALNAIAFIGASQFAGVLAGRFGLERVVKTAVAAYAAAGLVLFGAVLSGVATLPVLVALLFLTFGPLGLVVPSAGVLALDRHGSIAGTAASLMGTLQFITGAVMIGLVTVFFDGTALPMAAVIGLCAVGAFVLSRLVLVARDRVPAGAEAPAE